MDSIKSLMDKEEYELVIKLTEKSIDVDSLFYRISAFLGLGKGEEALKCLKTNRIILQSKLKFLIKVHIELLCLLKRFDEAYDELEYYKNLPYVSQEVEEILSSSKDFIRGQERQAYSNKTVNDDDIRSRLNSSEKNIVLAALDSVANRGVESFLHEIENILKNNPHQSLRSFALMLLVQKKIDRDFAYNSNGKIMNVNPSKLKRPFIGDPFERLTKKMAQQFKNPTITENAIHILSNYIIDIYPLDIPDEDNYLIGALFLLSSKLLRIKDAPDLAKYSNNNALELDKLEKLYLKLSKLMSD